MSGRIDPDRATDTRGRGTQGHLSPDPVLDLGQMRWRETLHQPPDGRRRRRGHRVQRLLGRIGAAPVHPDRKVPRSTARTTSTPTNNPSAQLISGSTAAICGSTSSSLMLRRSVPSGRRQ